jgi:hypothetical protein
MNILHRFNLLVLEGAAPGKIAVAAALAIAAAVAFVQPAAADCSEGKMLYLKIALEAPDVPADSFAAKPKVTYLLGTRYSRTEELPDPAQELHLLLVVNEPDVWMVNLVDHTGKHIVDPGPVFIVNTPVMPDVDSPHWKPLQIGRELAFMKSVAARRTAGSPDADGTSVYTHTFEGITAQLYVSKRNVPTKMVVRRPQGGFTLKYLEYDCRSPDLSLFQRPAGIIYREDR